MSLLMGLQQISGSESGTASSSATSGVSDISSTSGSSTSSAQSPLDQLFAAMDSDSSGSISRDEFSSFAEEMDRNGPPPPPSADNLASGIMSQIDTDGSGSMSQDELESFAQSAGGTSDQADKILAALDSDGDSAVSQTELADSIKQLMQTMQANMMDQAVSGSVSRMA